MVDVKGSDWIEKLVNVNKNIKIKDVFMPGSASSCTHFLMKKDLLTSIYNKRNVKQQIHIRDQFYEGIRLFDVNVICVDKIYYIISNYREKIITFKKFVDIINDIMLDNPNESIFLNITVDKTVDNKHEQKIEEFFKIKEVIDTDSEQELEKSKIYIIYGKYNDIFILKDENDTIDMINKHIQDNNNYEYMIDKKYTFDIDSKKLNLKYLFHAFISFLISTPIFSTLFWFYYTSNISEKERPKLSMLFFIIGAYIFIVPIIIIVFYIGIINFFSGILQETNLINGQYTQSFIKNFIFYAFFVNLYLGIFYLFFEKFVMDDLKNYDYLMHDIINSLNLDRLVVKKIVYDNCTYDINMRIIMKNFEIKQLTL